MQNHDQYDRSPADRDKGEDFGPDPDMEDGRLFALGGAFHPRWFGGRVPATAATETYGNGQDGWLAEYKLVSQEAVVPLPEALT